MEVKAYGAKDSRCQSVLMGEIQWVSLKFEIFQLIYKPLLMGCILNILWQLRRFALHAFQRLQDVLIAY